MLQRAFDLLMATAGIVLVSPLLAACSVAIILESPGPVLFRQRRIGRGGIPFTLIKLRSMQVNSHGLHVTASSDSRITRTGAWLRRYKLDELPQLLNVLRGEMSIVGPRPEVERYVDLSDPIWHKVLSVRPGLTDLATLCYRDEEGILARSPDPEAYYCEVILPDKLHLNVSYISTRSLVSDITLIGMTAVGILMPDLIHRGPLTRLFRVPQKRNAN